MMIANEIKTNEMTDDDKIDMTEADDLLIPDGDESDSTPYSYLNQTEQIFSITTTDVEKYMQRKLNAVVNGMREYGLYIGDDIEVRVISVEMGCNFVPFTVVLPMSVLRDKNRDKNNDVDNMLNIFNPKIVDNITRVYEPIMKMFASYLYNKADSEAFYSNDWRRARGVSITTSAVLKSNRLPRVQKLNNGTMERVIFLIDPIRIFHDMLMIEDDNTNFSVSIYNRQKIHSGEFRYDIRRSKRFFSHSNSNFADMLNHKMRENDDDTDELELWIDYDNEMDE